MKINGVDTPLSSPCTVLEYLESNGYNPLVVAIELNGEILPKPKYSDTALSQSDVLEIVKFIGGG